MSAPRARAGLWLLIAAAAVVRLAPILFADRVVADVARYQKLADHVLDVSWNPYLAPRLHPYPPVWVWFEAGSAWLARRSGASFAVLVKLPVLAADLAIVALLACWRGDGSAASGRRAAWLYALHPVSILVTGFHGQFDSLALFCVLAAIALHPRRPDAGALALAAGIGLKSFPILLLPLLLLHRSGTRERLRYAALATLPVAALLLPFAAHDLGALRRELIGYGGVADFGWIGFWRGLRWLATGTLQRAYPVFWGGLVSWSKPVFLLAYAGLLLALARRKRAWTLAEAALAIVLCFLSFYGALSGQYLLWAVPLGVLSAGPLPIVYGAAATLALAGFYLFLAPGVLLPAESVGRAARAGAGVLWVVGTGAVLAASVTWLAALLGKGRVAQ